MPHDEKIAVVIPTRGDRPDTLAELIADLAPLRTIIVTTGMEGWKSLRAINEGVKKREADTINITRVPAEGSPLNIQAWWNKGIRQAVNHGAKAVAILNDDVTATAAGVRRLVEPIFDERCPLTWVYDPEHSAQRVTPITGYAFALNPNMITPDETFEWWWGEHDLELRANAMATVSETITRPLMATNTGITHLRTDHTYPVDVSQHIRRDRERFFNRYPGLRENREGSES